VTVNRQVELTEPIEKGLVRRENVHTLGDIVAGKARLSGARDAIVYYKNNTGLAMQFAACGAILYRKLVAEGTDRVIPREWFASGQYGL
jgi:ornithine cyclodeaminase/alanine dehydrogenase-like protein (mu-crystallin family)